MPNGAANRLERLEGRLDTFERDLVHGVQWRPQSDPQWLAYESTADELFYGGAAGGMKTDLIIGLALTKHYNSIIFRREYPQLKAIIRRTRDILRGTGASYNGSDKLWRDIPGGRWLEFGAMQLLDDRENYQGRPHDLKAFDEITGFLKDQYTYVTAWTRSTIPWITPRVVCTGNPPTSPEGEWVIEYWAPWLLDNYDYPAKPGELRWFIVEDNKDIEVENGKPFKLQGKLQRPRSRTFIPSRLEDNPYLRDTNYWSVLMSLPEPLRTQLLKGDFSVRPDSDPWQVIPTEWVEAAFDRWKRGVGRPLANNLRSVSMTQLGADIARGGKANTVLAARYGTWFDELTIVPGSDTPDGGHAAALIANGLGFDYGDVLQDRIWANGVPVNVDIIGVGSSVYDILEPTGIRVCGVDFRRASSHTDRSGRLRMRNLRAEAYWRMREALDPYYGAEVALPPSLNLKRGLTLPRWRLTDRGIIIQEKDELEAKLGTGNGLDEADAVVLAWLPPQDFTTDGRETRSTRTYG